MDDVAALFEAWRRMAATCDGYTWAEEAGVLTMRTGLPLPPFNGVWQMAPQVSADVVLRGVDELAAGDLPWNVQLRPGYPEELDEAFAARGLTHTEDIPFMTVTSERLAAPDVDLELRPVVTYDDAGEHLRLLEECFGLPADLTRRRFPMGLLFVEGARVWLGRYDDEIVTTSLGIAVGGSVGVFNVATPERHRGKGYGGAATAQAVRAGFEAGAWSAWLQSSQVGESVYKGLGFTTFEQWPQWVPDCYLG